MMLKKKTGVGTLVVRYKQEDEHPGFYVDLKEQDQRELTPICNVEYDPTKNRIQVVVYGNTDSDEPTAVIDVGLKKK